MDLAVVVELPTDLAGWALVISVFGGVVFGAVKLVISSETKPITQHLEQIDARLDSHDKNLEKVHRIEQKISNGITDRTKRMEDRQDEIVKDMAAIKAALLWDGTERRVREPQVQKG